MFKRALLLPLLFAALSLAVPAHADDSVSWTAWLRYGSHMTLIDSHGDVLREVDLPFDEDFNYSLIDVSPDGQEVAFWVQSESRSDDNPDRISVYSLAANTAQEEIFAYALPENALIRPIDTQIAFNETGRFLAIGSYTDAGGWEILVLNIHSQGIIYRLSSHDLPDSHSAYIPVVRDYRGVEVAFTLVPLEGNESNRAYTWNTASGTIVENLAYLNLGAATFAPTGEVVMQYKHGAVFYDNFFVFDPLIGARYPFFAISSYTADLFFVQNGERIVYQLYRPTGSSSGWTLIGRDGTRIDDSETNFYASFGNTPAEFTVDKIIGTPNGFLYTGAFLLLENRIFVSIPAVFEVDTRDDALDFGRAVWSMNVRQFQSYFPTPESADLDIAWVGSDAPIGPFIPWAQLAEPVYAPTPQPTEAAILPTPIPPPDPIFQVGHEVRVQTIDGEILNLRAAPTRSSEILVYIEDDTRLLLLEGPVNAEGYTWWRVRTPDSLEGWVVENDGDLQTLMPL